jgi:hypothetical protein
VRPRLCLPFTQLGRAFAIDRGPRVTALPSMCTAPPRSIITHGAATGSRWLHLRAKTSPLWKTPLAASGLPRAGGEYSNKETMKAGIVKTGLRTRRRIVWPTSALQVCRIWPALRCLCDLLSICLPSIENLNRSQRRKRSNAMGSSLSNRRVASTGIRSPAAPESRSRHPAKNRVCPNRRLRFVESGPPFVAFAIFCSNASHPAKT